MRNLILKANIIGAVLFWLLIFPGVIPSSGAEKSIQALVQERLGKGGEILDLSGVIIGEKGAKELAKMEQLSSVTTLMLQGNKIKYRGLKALAQSPYLANLKHLDLWGEPDRRHGSQGSGGIALFKKS